MRTSTLRGEWWLVDGAARFADGDIVSSSHENMVVGHMTGMVLDALGMSDLHGDEPGTLDQWDLPDGRRCDHRNVMAELSWLPADDPLRQLGCDLEEAVGVAFAGGDPREFGVINLGWIRVINNCADVARLDGTTLRNLVDGLFDAYQYDLYEDGVEITIQSMLPRLRLFQSVPVDVLEEHNPLSVMMFERPIIGITPYEN